MNGAKKYRGVVVPMVTPFNGSGDLDEAAVRRIVDHLIKGGADGIFVLGTTGEKASIPPQMCRRLVEIAVEHSARRAMVYAGIGDDCLSDATEAATESFRLGADAVVAHLPCYYALQPEEMYDYYLELAERVKGPLILYNIPSTTHMSMPVEIVARLSEHPGIVGFKDSENSAGRPEEVARQVGGRPDFSLFIGAAVLSVKGLSLGMDGVVPSSGNLEPRAWRDICDSAQRGDWAAAERLQSRVNQIARIFQVNRTLGQSLAALKAAMSVRGLCGAAMLPPLRAAQPVEIDQIRAAMAELGLTHPTERVPEP